MTHPALTIRADLAHVTPTRMQVIAATAPLREKVGEVGKNDSEVYFGELVDVYEQKDGMAWVQNLADGYVGYVSSSALTAKIQKPTHRVHTLSAFVYPAATMKSVPLLQLSMGGYVRVTGAAENKYLPISFGDQTGFIYEQALQQVDQVETDFVAVAEKLIGVPYLWGGRTSHGIDCSGLVQLALSICGINVPKDTDQQEPFFKDWRTADTNFQRGNLVYFKGHVGIMIDAECMLHANAYNMDTWIEDLSEFQRRAGLEITSVIRLPADLYEFDSNRIGEI